MDNLTEFKTRYLSQLAGVQSFSSAWQFWQPHIRTLIKEPYDGQSLFDLGDHLTEIFQLTANSGRSQGTLSGGGAAWECLICWYLNLIFWDAPVFVARQNRNFVPSIVNDAICVTIANVQTNTESDIVIFTVPNAAELTDSSLVSINRHLVDHFDEIDICVLQCKTNWNDNAQIPMLWDLIYNSSTFRIPYVSVGRNGVNPSSFRQFSYAFVTVPSNSTNYRPELISVLRVRGLTGGNYWGKATTNNVAANVKELAGRHFGTFFPGGVVSHLNRVIVNDPSYPTQFMNLDF